MICTKCGVDKPQEEFYTRAGGEKFHTHCKECHQKYPRSQQNRQPYDDKWKQDRKDFLSSVKMEQGCKICGEKRHPHVLDFHHIDPSAKSFAIANKYRVGKKRLVEEINKCVILCANCHRLVHAGVLHL